MNDKDFENVKSLFYDDKALNLLSIIHDNVSFQDIQKKDIQQLNRILKVHSDIYQMKKVILFHGTCATHNISEEGIKKGNSKRKNSFQSANGFVCLSLYPSMAKQFGEMGNPYSDIKVYAVQVPIKDLKPDHDQLNNKRMYGEDETIGRTLADSLIYGSGCRLSRNVENYEVRDATHIFFPQPKKNVIQVKNNRPKNQKT